MLKISEELKTLMGNMPNLFDAAMKADALLTDEQRWEKLHAWTRESIAETDKENAEFVRRVRLRESARTCIPQIHADATLRETTGHIAHTAMLKSLLGFASEYQAKHRRNGVSIVFVGNPGTGKSRMASAMISQLSLDWPTSNYTVDGFEHPSPPVNAIFARQEMIVSELMRPGDAMNKYIAADLLVIDDLATRELSAVPREALCELMSERHDQRRTTIITTNKTFEQLCELSGERMASRFKNTATWLFLTCAWADYRSVQKARA